MTSAPVGALAMRGLVARGEERALLSAAGAYFCLLCGYYMLRSLREAMALTAGREWIPALFTVAFAVIVVGMAWNTWLFVLAKRSAGDPPEPDTRRPVRVGARTGSGVVLRRGGGFSWCRRRAGRPTGVGHPTGMGHPVVARWRVGRRSSDGRGVPASRHAGAC